MGLSKPAVARTAAGALLLLALTFSPPAHAQIPAPVFQAALDLVIICPDAFLEPTYAGQDSVQCVIRDLSRDSVYTPDATSGTSLNPHTIGQPQIIPLNESVNAHGWQVITDLTGRGIVGGEHLPFRVTTQATPLVDTQGYDFEIVVNVTSPGGYNKTLRQAFSAEVQNYDLAQITWADGAKQVQRAGQDDVVTFPLLVQNIGVYPDSFRFTLTPSHDDLRVTTPPNLFVPPHESRVVNISVLTPHGKLVELGRSTTVNIKVNSVTGSSVYSAVAVLNIRGAYLPVYWVPLLCVGLVSAGIVVRGSREKAQMRRMERGRPRAVEVTPRQAVLLAELKRSDPETYQEKKRSLDSVYKERVTDYREHRKERLAKDREEAKLARAEFLAAKKARKKQRAEEKRAAKLARAEEKRAAKLQRKEDKILAKETKKKEKILGKKRKVLEKERAKAAKLEAKEAAKQAKLDAKAAREEAKAAKKAAKQKKE